ncbi:MAG TPA: DUF3488 domain-containing protein, partial [Frankiaceae bacterium]|nr:DUF3488 domain-containing protein [Frankiaceae bacterium]
MRTRLPLPVVGGLATLLCATTLTPLFDGLGWWFGPAIGATVVAVACAGLARRLRLPLVLHPVLLLAGLAAYATVVCAPGTAWAGMVPTGRTVDALRVLADAGGADVRGLAAPVPERPGLVLFVVVGVYAVAALVDLLAVTARRAALAGLPLLGLFAVPAAVLPSGVGAVPFLLGGGGYVALLLAEGRHAVGRWGRPLSPAAGPEPVETSPLLGAAGRRIGVAALASALVVPLLVPGLGSGVFTPRGGGLGGGSGSTSVVQPIVALYQQLHVDETIPLIRVTTDTPQYLRLTALEQFDGQRFTLSRLQGTKRDRVSHGLPPLDTKGVTTTVTARVEVTGGLAEHYLPVPYAPMRVERLKGDWRLSRATRTIFSVHTDSAHASFQVTSEVPSPRPEELRAADGPVPPELRV